MRARVSCACMRSRSRHQTKTKGRVIRFNKIYLSPFKPLLWLNSLFFPVTLSRTLSHMKFFIYLKIYNEIPLVFINLDVYHTVDYFAYFCAVKIYNYIDMKQKKVFKYHLKNDVRDDLENLVHRVNYLLRYDGFDSIPSYSILPALFKVFSHLLWNRKFESWFKKVYD